MPFSIWEGCWSVAAVVYIQELGWREITSKQCHPQSALTVTVSQQSNIAMSGMAGSCPEGVHAAGGQGQSEPGPSGPLGG